MKKYTLFLILAIVLATFVRTWKITSLPFLSMVTSWPLVIMVGAYFIFKPMSLEQNFQ